MILTGLGRVFWMRQTLESVDLVKQIAFPNVVGHTQSVEGLGRSKSLPSFQEGESPLAWLPLNWTVTFPHLQA